MLKYGALDVPTGLALALVVGSLVGCSQDESTIAPAATTDNQAIGLMVDQDAENFGLAVEMDGHDVESSDRSGRLRSDGAPIESFYFKRLVRSQDVTRDVHFEHPAGEPATASLSVVRDLRGIFRLFYIAPDDRFSPSRLDKDLNATARRNALFVQRGGDRHFRNWRVAEISGVEIQSNPTTKIIHTLEIISPSVNRVVLDPLALVPVEDLPAFDPREEVTVRVTTEDASDFVFLHGPSRRKHELERLGGGVFEGTFRVAERRGRHRVAIDVIDADTLLDENAPYDAVIWGFNYRVATPTTDQPAGGLSAGAL